jgi:hypothetical protein
MHRAAAAIVWAIPLALAPQLFSTTTSHPKRACCSAGAAMLLLWAAWKPENRPILYDFQVRALERLFDGAGCC